jgi:hypothetical protein
MQIKKCKVCGNPKIEGHHPDYSKPKWRIPLCRVHHRMLHMVRRKHGNYLIDRFILEASDVQI